MSHYALLYSVYSTQEDGSINSFLEDSCSESADFAVFIVDHGIHVDFHHQPRLRQPSLNSRQNRIDPLENFAMRLRKRACLGQIGQIGAHPPHMSQFGANLFQCVLDA